MTPYKADYAIFMSYVCMCFITLKKKNEKEIGVVKKSRIHSYPSVDRNPETLPSA